MKGLITINEITNTPKIFIPDNNNKCPLITFERWLPITKKVHPELKEGLYLISSYGRVWSLVHNTFKTPELSNVGYYRVHLSTDNPKKAIHVSIHRAMLIEFCPVPNYESLVVNHIDGNKLNNHLWNLEWTTCSENSNFGYKESLRTNIFGTKFDESKKQYKSVNDDIPENDVKLIKEKLLAGKSILSIFKTTGYSLNQITKIKFELEGKSPNNYNLGINRYGESRLTFTDENIHAICKYFQDHKNIKYPAVSFLFRDCMYELFNIEYDKVMYKTLSYYYNRIFRKDITDLYDY